MILFVSFPATTAKIDTDDCGIPVDLVNKDLFLDQISQAANEIFDRIKPEIMCCPDHPELEGIKLG